MYGSDFIQSYSPPSSNDSSKTNSHASRDNESYPEDDIGENYFMNTSPINGFDTDQNNSENKNEMVPPEVAFFQVIMILLTFTIKSFYLQQQQIDTNRLLQLLASAEHSSISRPASIYHQPPKSADRDAAHRLAKRLYYLEGFRLRDVAKLLIKR